MLDGQGATPRRSKSRCKVGGRTRMRPQPPHGPCPARVRGNVGGRASASPDFLNMPEKYGLARTLALPVHRGLVLKAGLCPAPPALARFAPESRYISRIAWPPRRCRPPTLLAMGQNRRKTGNTCPLAPSARSGRMGLQWMRAKSNSLSPAQRQVQAGAQKANSYQ